MKVSFLYCGVEVLYNVCKYFCIFVMLYCNGILVIGIVCDVEEMGGVFGG